MQALEQALKGARLQERQDIHLQCSSKIIAYDGFILPYEKSLAGTNALVVGGDMTVCAVLNVVPMGRRESEMLYQIYTGKYDFILEYMEVYRIPLLDFEVRKPIPLSMPIAMDFGTSNTTAGVYLDNLYFEKAGLHDGERGLRANDTNYALFYDTSADWQETTMFPSVVGVQAVESNEPKFLFGYDAVSLADSSYIDEGFCVFYDIKRWIEN